MKQWAIGKLRKSGRIIHEKKDNNLIIFSARCTLHYLHHQEVLDPAECEHSKWI